MWASQWNPNCFLFLQSPSSSSPWHWGSIPISLSLAPFQLSHMCYSSAHFSLYTCFSLFLIFSLVNSSSCIKCQLMLHLLYMSFSDQPSLMDKTYCPFLWFHGILCLLPFFPVAFSSASSRLITEPRAWEVLNKVDEWMNGVWMSELWTIFSDVHEILACR